MRRWMLMGLLLATTCPALAEPLPQPSPPPLLPPPPLLQPSPPPLMPPPPLLQPSPSSLQPPLPVPEKRPLTLKLTKCLKCGDTCSTGDCHCGGEKILRGKEGNWCCSSGNCTIGEKKRGNMNRDSTCPGKTVSITEMCNGECNDLTKDRIALRDTSAIQCRDKKQCVKEVQHGTSVLCKGRALCADGSDLQWCKKRERLEEECPAGILNTRCNTNVGLPGQCVRKEKIGDGNFDCLDRSDERPYARHINSNPAINLTKLKTCQNGRHPGLTCSGLREQCLVLDGWCQNFHKYSCIELGWVDPSTGSWVGGLTTNNKELCSNTAFWAQHVCPEGRTRCTGSWAGQCVKSDCEGDCRGACHDKSDLHHPASEKPCDLITEFQCKKNNIETCLDISLKCNTFPECDDGSEEQDCREAFPVTATYQCESIHNNKDIFGTIPVKIWATPCNQVKECHQGLDEKFCNIDIYFYISVGMEFSSMQDLTCF